MTDNEIIKAFECCVKGVCDRARCPKYDSDEHTVVHQFCRRKIMLEALDLINRQKAEIERFADIGKMYSEIKAEAIKEFAERVKEKSSKLEMVCSGAVVKRDYTIDEKTLNNLVKEMAGEG